VGGGKSRRGEGKSQEVSGRRGEHEVTLRKGKGGSLVRTGISRRVRGRKTGVGAGKNSGLTRSSAGGLCP